MGKQKSSNKQESQPADSGTKSKKKGGGWQAKLEAEETAAKALADKQAALKNRVKFVHARHILVSDQSQAQDIIQQLRVHEAQNNGKVPIDLFETLAKQSSQCETSRAKGGRLAPFTKGQMAPEFEKAAFETKPVAIVGPVKTSFGYHVILVEKHT